MAVGTADRSTGAAAESGVPGQEDPGLWRWTRERGRGT